MGNIYWRVLRSSKSREQKKEAPSRPFRDRLCDGALPRPGEPVQPVDGRFVEVTSPEFDFVQNGRARTSETTISFAVLVPGLSRGPYAVEDSGFGCRRKFFQTIVVRNTRTEGNLTRILQAEVILCVRMHMEKLTIGVHP